MHILSQSPESNWVLSYKPLVKVLSPSIARAKAFESEVRLLYGAVLLNEGMGLRVGVGD